MSILHALAFYFALTAPFQAGPTVQQVASFPGRFAENIAVRANGDILVTSLSTPSVQHLDPKQPNVTNPLPPIAGANGISGITEISEDVFAVIAAIWNITARRSEHSAIWTLDFRRSSSAEPVLKKIVEVAGTTALNGLTHLPGTSTVLASDSAIGAVYSIDAAKQTYSIVIQDVAFAPTDGPTALGINGVRVHDSRLYFVNSVTGYFGRVPISKAGAATGPVELISRFNGGGAAGIDDFAVDEEGIAWVAYHPHSIVRVDRKGRQEIVAEGSVTPDPTSVVFARGGRRQQKTLYATTDLFGAEIDGGLVSIDISDS